MAKKHPDRRIRFTAAYTLSMLSVLFHPDTDKTIHVKEFLKPISGGNKIFACYLWWQKAYPEKRYDRAYAVADTVLAIVPKAYPLAHIYVKLIAAVGLWAALFLVSGGGLMVGAGKKKEEDGE